MRERWVFMVLGGCRFSDEEKTGEGVRACAHWVRCFAKQSNIGTSLYKESPDGYGVLSGAAAGDDEAYVLTLGGGVQAGGEAGDAREFQAVENLETAFIVLDYADGFEHGEVAEDGGPAQIGKVHRLCDAALSGGDLVDDLKAGGMAEGLED
jgi:hypothetical protein